jgi:hypothetical protein
MNGLVLRYHDKEFNEQLAKATHAGLLRTTVFLHTQYRLAVSEPNSGVRVPITRPRPGGNTTSRTIYPTPSKPGEYPRLRTGFGRSGIVWNDKSKPGKPVTRVGVVKNAIYMFHLDRGTRRIKPRPWILVILEIFKQAMGLTLATGIKRDMP